MLGLVQKFTINKELVRLSDTFLPIKHDGGCFQWNHLRHSPVKFSGHQKKKQDHLSAGL